MSPSLFIAIALSSLIPVTELQAAIPLFLATHPELPIWFVYLAAVTGAMIPPLVLIWLLPKTNDWIHNTLGPVINKWVIGLHKFFVIKKRMPWYYLLILILIGIIELSIYRLNLHQYWYIAPPLGIAILGFVFSKTFMKAHEAAIDNSSLIEWFYRKVHEQHSAKFQRWGSIALIIITGIPFAVPGAGVWTGAIVAFIFNIPYRRAILSILIGVLISAAIVTAVSTGIINSLGF